MTRFDEFKTSVKGKNITVIGIGISNLPLIRFLAENGANVKACDKRERDALGEICAELEAAGVELSLGDAYLSDIDGDIIFKTPGMRFDTPELLAAKARGASVTSEMEVFFDVCPSHIIAVTGSDGKTTTTTLIYNIMTEAGYKTWLGGNIGTPLLTSAGEMKNDDWVILELSSFQLHTMRKSPEIAVITNISPNHLNVHKGYGEYISAKENIMLYQNENDVLVVNADNELTAQIGREAAGEARYFSRRGKAFVYLDGETIKRCGTAVLNIHDIKIPGMYNVENYMAAIAAVYGLAGDDAVRRVAESFGGVEHRVELVRRLDGVRYYNSSIDSSPNRTINTLSVFDQKVIMIAGGADKGIKYDEIGPAIKEKVKTLILIGATAPLIEDAYRRTGDKSVRIIHARSYEDAVNTARSEAEDGDIVILSPASTSFDMFKNFEERGRLFKRLVNELK